MTEKQIIKWIDDHLKPTILKCIVEAKANDPDVPYSVDWLVALTYRETGFLIARYVDKGLTPENIYPLMKGDYSQRPGENEKQYHGFGLVQIDIKSFPEFVKSGDWKDPEKCYRKAIQVLESKRKYLQHKFPNLNGNDLFKAITASYNAGEGNVSKAIAANKNVDMYTHQHNYASEIWRLREVYNSI